MTIDDKIGDKKLQYDINRETAKTRSDQSRIIEQNITIKNYK